MKIKLKCFFLILSLGLLLSITLCGCSGSNSTPEPSNNSSSPTIEDLQTQVEALQSQNEILSASVELPQAISNAEDFLQRYFVFDTSSSNKYDSSELFTRYQDLLTDKGKALMKPADEYTKDISIVSSISRIKTFGVATRADTVQTLSVLQSVTNLSGIESTTNHIIQLTLKKVDNVWLIDSMDYDQTFDPINNNIF